MEYIRGSSRPRYTVRAELDSEAMMVPFLGNVGDARSMTAPQSGYDRANWFAMNTIGAPTARTASFAKGGRASIGSNVPRGLNGESADDYWTDSYWTGYNVVNYPEQFTEESEDVGSIWDVQTQASKGLNLLTWDQVYVNQDSTSVWS